MRRKAGVGGIKKKKANAVLLSKTGKEMEERQLSFVTSTLEDFRQTIADFAVKYKDRINEDAEFRQQFHQMCNSTGIDPLASNKGFWADLLGVGDYYFEIAVRVIDLCVRGRRVTGGILPLDELVCKLNERNRNDARVKLKAKASSAAVTEVSEADVRRAVDKLHVLGNGFRVLDVNGRAMVVSVPTELSNDHQAILALCQENGSVSEGQLRSAKKWTRERCRSVIDPLVRDGLVWLDVHAGETHIYFPAFWAKHK
jgi:ESCRT-II complex subunit VPS22